MELKRVLGFFVVMCINAWAFAQAKQSYTLKFEAVLGTEPLKTEALFYKLAGGDSVRLDLVKYYISGIELLQNGQTVFKEQNSFHLVDVALQQSANLSLNVSADLVFNAIKFTLGIDSVTNTSGALGGDLDPTKGMYWTWQNGYINCKLEGVSNLCATRKNQFQLHVGGYQFPYNAAQSVVLKVDGMKATTVQLDLKKVFTTIDLTKQNKVMSPGVEAVNLSALIASAFSIKAQ